MIFVYKINLSIATTCLLRPLLVVSLGCLVDRFDSTFKQHLPSPSINLNSWYCSYCITYCIRGVGVRKLFAFLKTTNTKLSMRNWIQISHTWNMNSKKYRSRTKQYNFHNSNHDFHDSAVDVFWRRVCHALDKHILPKLTTHTIFNQQIRTVFALIRYCLLPHIDNLRADTFDSKRNVN